MNLQELAAILQLELHNVSEERQLSRVSGIEAADSTALVFATDLSTASAALSSSAAAVMIPRGLFEKIVATKPLLLSANPKLDFARAARLLREQRHSTGIHPSATIAPSAVLAEGISIAAFVVIDADVSIGPGTMIDAGTVIGAGAAIGADCHIYPRVVVYPGTIIGDRTIVHAGAVLGSDGYGYVRDEATAEYLQFPQQGKLLIGDDVEIGANTTIDRGALDATVIERGAKLDNLIHLGHNVRVGENVLIAAQTGISGSTTIGRNAIIGGQVGVGDHAHIDEDVVLGSQAGVLPGKKLRATGGILWGTPAQPLKHILKEIGLLRRLRRAADSQSTESNEG